MEYIPFLGLFVAWLGSMIVSVPEAPMTYKAEVCELKDVTFAKIRNMTPDMRKAA